MNSKFRKILITGSTSGLGRELSLSLKEKKEIYLICAGRNKAKLSYLKKKNKK